MSFPTPDASIIALWGKPAVHYSENGLQTTVSVVEADDRTNAAPAVLRILFGTMAQSGFVDYPKKNDRVQFDGERYRVYDVKSDRPGGDASTDGIWLHLTFDE